MSTLRQLTRSSLENGGSGTRSWGGNTHHPSSERCAQVDEPVRPAHQIELGERWIGHEVVADEHATLADVAVDPVATLLAMKEPGDPLLTDLRGDRLRVLSLSRAFDRTLAQVAAE